MALLHPTFLDSVVAIGSCTSEEKRNWCATGFAYGFFVGMGADGRTPQDAAFLVTNRHVKEGIQGDIVIRCNPKEGGTGADVALSARRGRPVKMDGASRRGCRRGGVAP